MGVVSGISGVAVATSTEFGRDKRDGRNGRSPPGRRKGKNGRRAKPSSLKGRMIVRRGGRSGGRRSPAGRRGVVRLRVTEVGAVAASVTSSGWSLETFSDSLPTWSSSA